METAAPRKRGTRPRGSRVGVTMRIPDDQAVVYRSRADELGIPLSSWIAKALAEHEGLDIPDYVHLELEKAERERAIQATEQELDLPRTA